LFDEEGIIEAQIRTVEMHRLAEYGVAAHWKYKGGENSVSLGWLQSLHYQNESVEEFYELAKSDLFSEDITVFSPKGDYYTLPKGSVALDFAYAIHSKVGATATEALINKQKASLLSVLKNGDIVKIIKDKEPHLYCSWSDTVKTSKAQEGIRSACRSRIREADTLSAYNILGALFSQKSTEMIDLIKHIELHDTIYKLPTTLDYYKEVIHQVAEYLGTKELRFWELLKKGYKKPNLKEIEHFSFFTNKTLDGTEFDYCCHPKVGDQVVAFYQVGKAVVHHKMCKKAYSKMLEGEKMIYVKWSGTKLIKYRLTISLQNKKGILADLLAKLSELNLNLLSIEFGIKNSEEAEFCQIEAESTESKKHLIAEKISQKFKLIEIISLDDAYNN
jgi:(p)ppGpp synthase/HD superfamily hydrolase